MIRRNEKGFTLIELLIVVVIIGILAAIAIFQSRSVSEAAYESTIKADLSMLAKNQEVYHHLNLRYGSLAELTNFRSSDGVDVSMGWLSNNGFAVTATHSAIPGKVCGYFVGDAPAEHRGPATQEGEVRCQ